jgi:ssDNA-binding Zn-finger/Zn-ribbon topoisomerase 1
MAEKYSENMPTIEKRCPDCGRELVIRTNRYTGHQFIGCTGYPANCAWTDELPESLKLRLAGAPTLPGME